MGNLVDELQDERMKEIAEAHGLRWDNSSVEDTLAQRDALMGVIGGLRQIIRSGPVGIGKKLRLLDAAITDGLELCATIERILELDE